MIGPGWMPSRPRPLPRVRSGLWSYTPGYVRRQRTRRRRSTGTATAREPPDLPERFDGALDLPTARLLPSRAQPRYRTVSQDLRHWLEHRWAWLRPRSVPMAVALASLFAVLGAAKYLADPGGGPHEVTRAYLLDRPLAQVCRDSPTAGLVVVRSGDLEISVSCR